MVTVYRFEPRCCGSVLPQLTSALGLPGLYKCYNRYAVEEKRSSWLSVCLHFTHETGKMQCDQWDPVTVLPNMWLGGRGWDRKSTLGCTQRAACRSWL